MLHMRLLENLLPAASPAGPALSGSTPPPKRVDAASMHNVPNVAATTCSRWKPFIACNQPKKLSGKILFNSVLHIKQQLPGIAALVAVQNARPVQRGRTPEQ